MASLIRFAQRAGAPPDPKLDQRVGPGDVTIGRAGGCDVRLVRAGVAFRHAVLREESAGLSVIALPGATVSVDGHSVDQARLERVGDAVRLGHSVLTLAAAAADGAYTIIVTQDGAAPAPDEVAIAAWYGRAFAVHLPNVRLLAFGLCCVLAVLFFAVPFAFAPGQLGAHSAAAGDRALALGTQPATVPAHLTALWNVGRFSSGHSGFGGDCAHCHQAAFVHIPSSACLNCHRDIGQHASPAVAPAADLNHERCETCHREHKGLVMANSDKQSDCVACHGNIRTWAPHTAQGDVHDFGTGHPQFAPALVQNAALHTTVRVKLGSPDVPDGSGLRFTHAKHLALDTMKGTGDAACAQCHVAAPGGVTFQRVDFETSCARCHTLQFEPRHPEWRLPHGDPGEIASRIGGFYARATLAGEQFPAPSSDLFAKPGAPLPPPPLQGAPLVANQVAAAMMSSIARSACGQCHTVTRPAAGTAPDAWTVAPVYVADRFEPRANFSHASHATSSCGTCHAARASDGGPLALLPGIATCRLCHAGEAGATQRVASTCVTCHDFHDAALPLLPGAVARPATIQSAFAAPGATAHPTEER